MCDKKCEKCKYLKENHKIKIPEKALGKFDFINIIIGVKCNKYNVCAYSVFDLSHNKTI